MQTTESDEVPVLSTVSDPENRPPPPYQLTRTITRTTTRTTHHSPKSHLVSTLVSIAQNLQVSKTGVSFAPLSFILNKMFHFSDSFLNNLTFCFHLAWEHNNVFELKFCPHLRLHVFILSNKQMFCSAFSFTGASDPVRIHPVCPRLDVQFESNSLASCEDQLSVLVGRTAGE